MGLGHSSASRFRALGLHGRDDLVDEANEPFALRDVARAIDENVVSADNIWFGAGGFGAGCSRLWFRR